MSQSSTTFDSSTAGDVFEALGDEFETLIHGHDLDSGLRAIIAIHSTALGPALGGTRFYPYVSGAAALRDVLRLARGMSFKAAAAGIDLGGGKAVIIGDPTVVKTSDLLAAYGRLVESLGGRYITTADVGTTSADMEVVARSTQYVTGTPGGSGDPSPLTAFGVWTGMKAVAAELWGDDSLHGRHVAVQGLGKVGAGVVRHLVSEGAQVTVADVNSALAESISQETGVEIAGPEEIVSAQCDILAPCALGGVVNDKTIPLLRTSAIAGAANNQLERPEHGRALANMGILYAPDYVINAGGLINVEDELHGYDRSRAQLKAAAIGDRLRLIFDRAASAGVSTAEAADEIARERIASAEEKQGRRGVSLPDFST